MTKGTGSSIDYPVGCVCHVDLNACYCVADCYLLQCTSQQNQSSQRCFNAAVSPLPFAEGVETSDLGHDFNKLSTDEPGSQDLENNSCPRCSGPTPAHATSGTHICPQAL